MQTGTEIRSPKDVSTVISNSLKDFVDQFKGLLNFLCFCKGSVELDDIQTVTANTRSAPPVSQGSPATVEAYSVES